MNDYDTFLLSAVSTLPRGGAQGREKLYNDLRQELRARLHHSLISKSGAEIVSEQHAFDAAINRTEMTFNSQADGLFLPPLPELNISHEAGNDNGHPKSIGVDDESLDRSQLPDIEWVSEQTSPVTPTRSIRQTFLGIRRQLLGIFYIVAGAGLIFAILTIASISRR